MDAQILRSGFWSLTSLTLAQDEAPVWLLDELPDDCPEHVTRTTSPACLSRSSQVMVRSSPVPTLCPSTLQLRIADPGPNQEQFRLNILGVNNRVP